MSSVSEKALIAVRWSYLGSLARVVSQLVANIVLARILGPESFGVFAIALLLVGPVKLISELGMGSALIQIETITRESVHCVFTWLQIAGIMTTIFFLIVASYVGWLFNSPVVAEAIRYISVVFLCYPATLIASSMLQRNLNLRAIQIASVNGYAIGFLIVGIGCALMGLGALSLILAFVVQALVDCILLLVQAKPHLRLRFQKIDRSLVSYAK